MVIYYDTSCPAESLLSIEIKGGWFKPKFSTFENVDNRFTDHIRAGSFGFGCGKVVTCCQFWKQKFLALDTSTMFSIEFFEWCNPDCTPELHTGTYNLNDYLDDSEKTKHYYRPELTRTFLSMTRRSTTPKCTTTTFGRII